MTYGPQICACCGSMDGVEAHHLYLRSEGCPDELTVWLCHACHGKAHSMQRRVDIRAATRNGLARAASNGRRLGGYRGGPTLSDCDRRKASAAKQILAMAFARDVSGVIAEIRAGRDLPLAALADALNARGVPTRRGGFWTATAVRRVLARAAA